MPYITEDISYPSRLLCEHVPREIRDTLADNGSLGTRIDVLIGNDYYHYFILSEKLKYGKNLYLINSPFGWLWSGRQSDVSINHELSVITYIQGEPCLRSKYEPDRPLREIHVHKLWDLEAIRIADCPKATRDDQAVEEYHKSVKLEKGRYWIKWPWIQNPPELPDNFSLAYGRLVGLLKRMNDETLENYDKLLQDQINKGILEKVEVATSTEAIIHYLPHHHVKKGDKMRLVYDASSKLKGTRSLNVYIEGHYYWKIWFN